MGKASVKRCVLRADLKEERVGGTLRGVNSEGWGQQLRRPDHPKSGAQSGGLVAGWQRWT